MAYIGNTPSQGVRNKYVYEATANQQAFTGADSSGFVLSVSDKVYTDVFQNGVLLKSGTDYSVTSTTVTLVAGALVDDVIEIITYDIGTVDNSVSSTLPVTFRDSNGTDKVNMGGANSEMDLTGSLGLRVIKSGETNYSIVAGDDGIATHLANRIDGTTAHGQIVWSTRDGGTTLERMRLDASGNVAIGHATPNSKLRLQKDGAANYSNMTISNANSTGAITFGVGGSGTGNYLANNAFLLNQGNSALIFGQNDTERMRINTDGNLAFPSGKGIDFSATSDGGGMTSEVLDDYEEGSFTPSTYADSGNFALNSSYNTLFYTKVGRAVHITGYLYTTSTNSPSGTIILGNLPFTSGSSVTNYAPVDIRVWGISADPGTGRSNSSQVYARILNNNSAIYIYDTNDTSVTGTAGNWLNIDGTTDFLISATYFVD